MSGIKTISVLAGATSSSGTALGGVAASGAASVASASAGAATNVAAAVGGAATAAAPVISSAALGTVLAASAIAAATVLATGAVVVGGVTVANMGAKALKNYQARQREEGERVQKREREIQRRISEVRAKARSYSGPSKIAVQLPTETTMLTGTEKSTVAKTSGSAVSRQAATSELDNLGRVRELQSRMPNIKSEYQALVLQELLEPQTVNQALQKTEEALSYGNLGAAETYLQTLDDARIQATQKQRSQWEVELDYVRERLDALQNILPAAIVRDLEGLLQQARNNWRQLTNADIEVLHNKISEFEIQADRINQTAEDLVNSWLEAGYDARVVGVDNGDVVVEIETHEGANTQMRVQFDGQQMNLFGPEEESYSCAARTTDALRIFQEQGYYLQWDSWNGQPVDEEWREINPGVSVAEPTEDGELEETDDVYVPASYKGRLEGQGA